MKKKQKKITENLKIEDLAAPRDGGKQVFGAFAGTTIGGRGRGLGGPKPGEPDGRRREP